VLAAERDGHERGIISLSHRGARRREEERGHGQPIEQPGDDAGGCRKGVLHADSP
jgi:hypothetical protein